MKYRYTKEQLKEIVQDSKSIMEVCRKMGIKPAGGNYTTVKYKIKNWKIDTSHFTGKGWNKELKFNPNPAKSLSEILIENSNYQSYKLKNRLLKEGVKNHICENCKNTKWLDKPLPLELHHINGDRYDNRIENIQLLCPNCHTLTDNYRGKNIKK